MSRSLRLSTRTACIAILTLASFATSEAKTRKDDKEKADRAHLLTRSIYLPVEFKVCEHLRNAVLYQGDEAVSLLPVKRIFQFTYYPSLDRIEPFQTDLRVEGVRNDGSPFVGRLAVTAWGVFAAHHKIELDMNRQLQKMRYRLDVRYDPMVIRIRCSDSCEKDSKAKLTAAEETPDRDER